MVEEEIFIDFDSKIIPDKNHAQILIDVSPSSKTFEEAEEIIEGFGVNIIEKNYLSSNCILVKLDALDMREITLKLIERGFISIKGINAKPFQT